LHFLSHEGGDVEEDAFEDGAAALFVKRMSEELGKEPFQIAEDTSSNDKHEKATAFSKVIVELDGRRLSVKKERKGVVMEEITQVFVSGGEAILAFNEETKAAEGKSEVNYEDQWLTIETAKDIQAASYDHLKILTDNKDSLKLLKQICDAIVDIKTSTGRFSGRLTDIRFIFKEFQLACSTPLSGDKIQQSYNHYDENLKRIKTCHENIFLHSVDKSDHLIRLQELNQDDYLDLEDAYKIYQKVKKARHILEQETEKYAGLLQDSYRRCEKGDNDVFYTPITMDEYEETEGMRVLAFKARDNKGITYHFLPGLPDESLKECGQLFDKYYKPLEGSIGDIFIKLVAERLDV